jgi:hypothetical protein
MKLAYDHAHGVLVIPCWKSAIFWPFICPNGCLKIGLIDLRKDIFILSVKMEKVSLKSRML